MAHASYGNNSQQSPEAPSKAGSGPQDQKGPKAPPAAGPHAKPELTNEDATPGAGTLPEPGHGDSADSTTG